MNRRSAAVRTILATAVLSLLTLAGTAAGEDDVVMKAMRDELARSVAQLKQQGMEAPYFIAYTVDDVSDTWASATLGALTRSDTRRVRMMGVELRVGDYNLDNSNYFSFQGFSPYSSRMMRDATQVPLDDNYREIRRQLWLATDAEYKKAVEDMAGKRAALQNRRRTEEVPDFSREEPVTANEPPRPETVDRAALEALARELSALFRQKPVMLSSVTVRFVHVYRRFVNNEGTSFTRSKPLLRLEVRAQTRAPDGLPLEDSFEFYGRSAADLPARQQLAEAVEAMAARLKRMEQAAFLDRYNGPVLFEDRAAAEIFAQVFAPGLVATRAPMSDNPQFEMVFDRMMAEMGSASLLDRLGGRVLPDFLDVADNPRLERFGSAALAGSYSIDDDGVPARENRLVEQGVLKALLTARTPVQSIRRSSGSRRGWGPAPSNLILSASRTASREDLRRELLRRAQLRGHEYGVVVRRVGGGALGSLRGVAMAMAAQGAEGMPATTVLEVYRLYPDGREEPVRGAEFSGVTPAAFRDIVAAGDAPVVYSDVFLPRGGSMFSMGASVSGESVPIVSYVVPSLLFEELTLRKTTGTFPRPPASQPPPLGQ